MTNDSNAKKHQKNLRLLVLHYPSVPKTQQSPRGNTNTNTDRSPSPQWRFWLNHAVNVSGFRPFGLLSVLDTSIMEACYVFLFFTYIHGGEFFKEELPCNGTVRPSFKRLHR